MLLIKYLVHAMKTNNENIQNQFLSKISLPKNVKTEPLNNKMINDY